MQAGKMPFRPSVRAKMIYAEFVEPSRLQQMINETVSPLLIHFTAHWCGPCQGMTPHLESFARERQNDMPVVKVDVDAFPDVARRFMVRAVPTLILLQDGKVLGVHSGALSAAQLARFVDGNLPGTPAID